MTPDPKIISTHRNIVMKHDGVRCAHFYKLLPKNMHEICLVRFKQLLQKISLKVNSWEITIKE